MEYLKETKGLNQGQVASTIGVTSGAITKMLKNERAITKRPCFYLNTFMIFLPNGLCRVTAI
ncbi:hypothetical protein LEP1GSC043_0413 [Leptospira weilii str. Ecochallenge]|uniref:DNA-binding helix-turn-helix protein n=1 Tax=Leptospira weilii str. Ecochallenge TaxID=1049986 RepID=N1U7F2_9LEPT|nr:hypothetical protein LEP1GSC043_0413 [Leptospira weilii str. Ecochallenge]